MFPRFVFTLFTLFLMLPVEAFAQVNTEALRIDSDKRGFITTLQLTGNVSAGNTSIYEINTNGRVDYVTDRNHSFAIADYRYGYKNSEPYKNSAFIALRNTWSWKPRIGVETFVQQQMDEFIRLKDRKLIGAGLRLHPIDFENDETGSKFNTYIGVGAMYEREVFDATATDPSYTTSLLRSTNYISLQLALNETVRIGTVQYLQIAPSSLNDFRYIADGNVNVRLAESTSLVFVLRYRLDNEPPAGIRPFDLSYTTGIRFSF
jgi:hypothetical protein